jgi:hypothetical protein
LDSFRKTSFCDTRNTPVLDEAAYRAREMHAATCVRWLTLVGSIKTLGTDEASKLAARRCEEQILHRLVEDDGDLRRHAISSLGAPLKPMEIGRFAELVHTGIKRMSANDSNFLALAREALLRESRRGLPDVMQNITTTQFDEILNALAKIALAGVRDPWLFPMEVTMRCALCDRTGFFREASLMSSKTSVLTL